MFGLAKIASEEYDEWYRDQRDKYPEYDKLWRNYEKQDKAYNRLHGQLDQDIIDKQREGFDTGIGVGGTIGGIGGGLTGLASGYFDNHDKGPIRKGLSMMRRAPLYGIGGAIGGAGIGIMAMYPRDRYLENKQRSKNPELYQKVQDADRERSQAIDDIDDWEMENLYDL